MNVDAKRDIFLSSVPTDFHGNANIDLMQRARKPNPK
jgi:hypothetical protein